MRLGATLASTFALHVAAAVLNQEDSQLHARQDSGVVTGSSVNGSEYEYVIVGSGAGGSPLAARLALAGHSVLLIEAGDNQTDTYEYKVPALHAVSSEFEKTRWDYWIRHYEDDEQQKRDSKLTYTLANGSDYTGLDPPEGAKIKGVLYPRAGTLGGCTAHNALVTIYPNEVDWENLMDITGDDSWAPDNMRGYFEKLEHNKYLPTSIVGHGYTGWLPTSRTSLTLILQDLKVISLALAAASALGQGLLETVITTVAGLGHVLLTDINTPGKTRDGSEGLYQVPLAMQIPEYKRASPVDFLNQVVFATNSDGSRKYKLDIAMNTFVTKINLDESGSTIKATGVDFLAGQYLFGADPRRQSGSATDAGVAGSVSATREVIISAGTFNTPSLLKLSGIGPRAELESHGIETKVDLPGVGKNLQDRYEVAVAGRAPTPINLLADCMFLNGTEDPCLANWEGRLIEKGVYSTNGLALAVLKKSTVAQNDTTDLFIAGWPAHFIGYYPSYFEQAVDGRNAWSWVPLKAHTRNNNGSVLLNSADPLDVPSINFRNFDVGGEEDLQALVEAQKYGRKIFEDLIPLEGKFTEDWPGQDVQTDDEWKQFIKYEAWGHHACCTAKIGSDDDQDAVLDSNFKVRGVDGLRVVDASVFPKIPGYFIATPIYMISEKAAEVILADAT
ncbi:Putative glucose-methanol-choline oxidoreductase, FAD/NAD(P)-binding domain superfamily [Septoria linicola]|uniref:Glucose-methanol-choline oxidoreductase, FAD/NAD(P)-binding domain superfamily n=1 Tax=Septoria linicola TaxID=215465 RepID=A0A9Q9AJX1_9PEZI|nr:putative glucose-methanol-choline oxidoreductase, FAD/NAD(P)-binding domain superfamily [Septoria linicola]USW48263.1 Putative glucose-methanol-choline oxidoreductase, FAD/NAD(P)-binding domain superfamily [Septoria linicola]